MLRSEYKLKSPRYCSKILPCLFGGVDLEIVQYDTDFLPLWILVVEYL